MGINVKKGVWYGTINTENDKQTYGYAFKKKHTSNGKLSRWYVILRFLVYHTTMGGVTKERTLKFANRTCTLTKDIAMDTSNHDIFTALSNCDVIYHKRIGNTILWFANLDIANELLTNVK